MSHLIEVAFKGDRKEFFLWEPEETPTPGARVIVDADRGEDLGTVHSVGERAALRYARVPHGVMLAPATRIAKRLATPDEVLRLTEVRLQDDEARRRAMERVKANALVMKLTDAEWQWDRKKLTFYFTAEKRVDFRTLVRELASMFRTRIELKQIGVRDEAKRLDGIGRCGRQYCSASWLPELRPVNLGVAKDQRLSLNPSQISGACGRLMCCLRYEHEFYVQSRKKYPKEGKPVRTSRGEEKVLANDIFRERVTLRSVEGDVRTVALADLRDEMSAAGDALADVLASAARVEPASTTSTISPAEPSQSVELPALAALAVVEEDDDGPHRIEDAAEEPVESVGGVGTLLLEADDSLEPELSTVTLDPAGEAGEEGRRPPRRRGRRGGRRNRPGGSAGAREPRDGDVAPEGV